MPYLRVNKLGKRFTPEYEPYNHLALAMQNQPGAINWYITDGDAAGAIDKMWTPSSSCYGPKEVWVGAATSENALKADTLEELAGLMGVPADAFVETINHWNAMCEAGEDTDFHMLPSMMHPIKTAPFYANLEGRRGAVHRRRAADHAEFRSTGNRIQRHPGFIRNRQCFRFDVPRNLSAQSELYFPQPLHYVRLQRREAAGIKIRIRF